MEREEGGRGEEIVVLDFRGEAFDYDAATANILRPKSFTFGQADCHSCCFIFVSRSEAKSKEGNSDC